MLKSARIVIIGFGSVGQTLVPLLLKHFDLNPTQLSIITADERGRRIAELYKIEYVNYRLTQENYVNALSHRLRAGDWLLNLAVGVSSFALVSWCRYHGVLYLDTSLEPWIDNYCTSGDRALITNYALRYEILKLHATGSPTAVVAHGANPGLISHFVKSGLVNLARLKQIREWSSLANLAQQLNIKVVQIAERDTQGVDISFNPGVFFNTWSVEGLIAEAWRHGELGWGSHEKNLPENGYRHLYGDEAGICIGIPGAEIMVKSWLQEEGEQIAYLIAHHEALSIANFLTIQGASPGSPAYRPTVFYAYCPSHLTRRSLECWVANKYRRPRLHRIMQGMLEHGMDRLGALFVFPGGCYWYGSALSLDTARQIVSHGNATTLQVAAGVLGALDWMCHHPQAGVVEAESIDTDAVMRVAKPYLGEVSGVLGTWQPSRGRGLQFADFLVPTHQSFDLVSHARILDHA